MPVPLGQLSSSTGSVVITTTPSASSVYTVLVTFTASIVSATLFVPPADVSPNEPSHKLRKVECSWEKERMLAAYEDLWASEKSFSLVPGLSSASQLPLVTQPIAVPSSRSAYGFHCGSGACELILSFSLFVSPVV